MKRIVWWVISAQVIMSVCFGETKKLANETPLPKAPEGYKWERFLEVKSAFLCPTNWHRIQKAAGSSHTYALSKEPVKTNGLFETGLTLQVVKGLQKKTGVALSVTASKMGEAVLRSKDNKKLDMKDVSSGPFKAFFIRYRNAPPVKTPIVIHQVYISNDKKDTLFIVTFEAPEKSWEEAWKIGEPMVKMFLIDDEY
jgi:hypothetical protein